MEDFPRTEDKDYGKSKSHKILEGSVRKSDSYVLQRGICRTSAGDDDAQENPYEVIASGRLHEQQKYIIETNHVPHYISLIVSDEFYQGLEPDQQKIIEEASESARDFARNASDERVKQKISDISSEGTMIISLP